ncbi:unnamed protein product [Ascophyllum nodosum]
MKHAGNALHLSSLLLAVASVSGGCPFLADHQDDGTELPIGGGHRLLGGNQNNKKDRSDGPDFSAKTYNALRKDIVDMFTDSMDYWPADFGNYAPLMIRLTWHCAGSYRLSDGRGGCDGGRIRSNPARGWADNTNLDKALTILLPTKLKYGDAVSWSDLIILTGNVAIESMGGPVVGFCAGRQDDESGSESLELGPSDEQEAVAPCEVNGACEPPLGTGTVGLIYVNPAGPLGDPNPDGSADEIRDIFGRMGMNDSETVALIGGGHAFGKFHGACPTGAGAGPDDAPDAPWPGTCGDAGSSTFGHAENTFTSGFEGQWTVEPTAWDNAYFYNLLEYDWELEESPADQPQWFPVHKDGANEIEDEMSDIRMLTADIALLRDPEYLALVELFASDLEALETSFSNAWYKLTTRDMGPHSRCAGTDVPPPQVFQLPLPDQPASPSYDYRGAMKAIKKIVFSDQPEIQPDTFDGHSSYVALFVTLAYQCASTFRITDYAGGCNGARIRLPPQSAWASNIHMDQVLNLLEPVKTAYPDISYADLIVMAGNTAHNGRDMEMTICNGRVDAIESDDQISIFEPREYDDVITGVRDRMKIMGLSLSHFRRARRSPP